MRTYAATPAPRTTASSSPADASRRHQAEANCLWFSDWYLQNLDALFTAPLDYPLWRFLDEREHDCQPALRIPAAELLRSAPALRINYETLTQFLPVRSERYLSDAKRQMATEHATHHGGRHHRRGRMAAAEQDSVALLVLHRGRLLPPVSQREAARLPLASTDAGDEIRMKEFANSAARVANRGEFSSSGPARELRPTRKELEQAAAIVTQHGPTKAAALLPRVINRLKEKWPDAKTFGAITRYLPEVMEDLERHEKRRERDRAELNRIQQEEKRRQAGRNVGRTLEARLGVAASTSTGGDPAECLWRVPFLAKTSIHAGATFVSWNSRVSNLPTWRVSHDREQGLHLLDCFLRCAVRNGASRGRVFGPAVGGREADQAALPLAAERSPSRGHRSRAYGREPPSPTRSGRSPALPGLSPQHHDAAWRGARGLAE